MIARPLFLPIAALLLAGGAAPGGAIDVAVTGVRDARGTVHVDICTRATFLKDCPYRGDAPAVRGTTLVRVHGVPPGEYAAQAVHDRNRNGEVDRAIFGIPVEGVGFSNDAPIRMAPPRWADAAFDHGAGDQRIGFRLRYFAG